MRNRSTVPTDDKNLDAQARQIAMEVGKRRKSGEILTDEEVLQNHPDMLVPLRQQLLRLRQLEVARALVDQLPPLASKNEPCSENAPLGDMANTLDLPRQKRAGEAIDDSADEMRVTIKEALPMENGQQTMVVEEPSDTQLGTTPPAPLTPIYSPSVRAPMGVLRLYHDGSTDYTTYPQMSDRFRIGRVEGDLLVPHDFWMSGRHAEIQRRKQGEKFHWFLVDLNSTNGTFVQVDFANLKHNDELFLGQERYRFVLQSGRAGLMHVTTGSGQQWWLNGAEASIGCQPPCGLSSFTIDQYLCPLHAKLKRSEVGDWRIHDNHSRNGVWLRVREVELSPNCQFQLGEQRFGFWFHGDHPLESANLRVRSQAT